MTDPSFLLRAAPSGPIVLGTPGHVLTFDADGRTVSGQPVTGGGLPPFEGAPDGSVLELVAGVPTWSLDGMRCVDTIAERDTFAAAPVYCRKGMQVFVDAVQCVYELGDDLTTWRLFQPSPALASQSDWYVADNGSDNNSGKLGSPLLSFDELARRVCPYGGRWLLTRDVTVHSTGAGYLGISVNVGSADDVQHTLTLDYAMTAGADLTLTSVVQPNATTRTDGQITVSGGTLSDGELLVLTSGTNAGAGAYIEGLSSATVGGVSFFTRADFSAFHVPAPAANGDHGHILTLNTAIRRLEVNCGINARVLVRGAKITRAIVTGVNEGTPSSDNGGNVGFAFCQAVSTAGYWQSLAGGACLFNCRWTKPTFTALKGAGWLVYGGVCQGTMTLSNASAHSYGFDVDGGFLDLGADCKPGASFPDGSAATWTVNSSNTAGGGLHFANGTTGTAITVRDGCRLTVADFVFDNVWSSAACHYSVFCQVDDGGWVYQQNSDVGVLLANFQVGSTTNWIVGGLSFGFSDNPITVPNQSCGVIGVNSNLGPKSWTDAGDYRTRQTDNLAALNVGLNQAGLYHVSGYVAVTKNDAAASGTPVLNAIFTDDSGVQRTVPIATGAALTTLGGGGGLVPIESNGTPIQVSVTGIATKATAEYSVRWRIEKKSSGA